MTFSRSTLALAVASALAFSQAAADTVVTKDGSTLKGSILGIEEGSLVLSTAYAGEVKVSMSAIENFSTDGDINLSFESGSAYIGKVTGSADGKLTIDTTDGQLTTNIAKVSESWQPGETSPAAKRQAAELAKLERNWSYEAAADLTGKSGNSESTSVGASFRAKLDGPDDTLQFYAAVNFEESNGAKSADDAKGGVDYTNKISSKRSWYVRSEAGRDEIEGLELYVNTGVGFGYTPISAGDTTLTYRSGLSYRFESYEGVSEDLSSAGLDFGLIHSQNFSWGAMSNTLTYTPVFDDFGNFRLVQDSGITLPLKKEGWSLRIGVANDYNSEPQPGKDELDTTYYTRLLLQWD